MWQSGHISGQKKTDGQTKRNTKRKVSEFTCRRGIRKAVQENSAQQNTHAHRHWMFKRPDGTLPTIRSRRLSMAHWATRDSDTLASRDWNRWVDVCVCVCVCVSVCVCLCVFVLFPVWRIIAAKKKSVQWSVIWPFFSKCLVFLFFQTDNSFSCRLFSLRCLGEDSFERNADSDSRCLSTGFHWIGTNRCRSIYGGSRLSLFSSFLPFSALAFVCVSVCVCVCAFGIPPPLFLFFCCCFRRSSFPLDQHLDEWHRGCGRGGGAAPTGWLALPAHHLLSLSLSLLLFILSPRVLLIFRLLLLLLLL